MNEHTPNQRSHIDAHEVPESELLMTRILDAHASEHDRARFQALADGDWTLWRALALRQQDMARLVDEIEPHIDQLCSVDLPDDAIRNASSHSKTHRGPHWLLAFSGWAALIVMGILWYALQQPSSNSRGTGAQQVSDLRNAAELSPDEHLQHYLQAPFVIGELAPSLLQVETLSDGRVAMRFLRRIEEVAFLDPNATIPVDDHGQLTQPPAALRSNTRTAPPSLQ